MVQDEGVGSAAKSTGVLIKILFEEVNEMVLPKEVRIVIKRINRNPFMV